MGDETTTTTNDFTVVSDSLETGFNNMKDDALDIISLVVPIAIGIFGLTWGVKKAMQWFRSLAK